MLWRPPAWSWSARIARHSEFSWQLERVLPVPVFAQTMAQVTVACGPAAAQSTEFTDAQLPTAPATNGRAQAIPALTPGRYGSVIAAARPFVASRP